MDRRKDMSHLKLPVCPRLAFNGSQLFQRLRYRHLSMKHRSICATVIDPDRMSAFSIALKDF